MPGGDGTARFVLRVGLVALVAVAAAGCAMGDLPNWTGTASTRTVEQGPAVPAGTVTGEALPPPSGATAAPPAGAASSPGSLPPPGAVAAAPNAALPPAQTGLGGRWTYATLTQSCAMTFQEPTPGSSGALRGAVSADPTCPGAAARARVFEVQENGQVLVFSQAGVLLLRLGQQGPQKLAGNNTIGETVTLTR